MPKGETKQHLLSLPNKWRKKTKQEIMNITGRITRNAEVRAVGDDRAVVSFSVAVNNNYRKKDGERVQQTAFYDCSYWRTTAIADYLKRGTLVELTGWITARAWLDMQGEVRASLNMNIDKINFLGKAEKQEQQPPKNQPSGSNPTENKDTEDDLPF